MANELQNGNMPEKKEILSRRAFFRTAKRVGIGLVAFIPGAYELMKAVPVFAAGPDYVPCQFLTCIFQECIYPGDPNQSWSWTCYDQQQTNYFCCCSDCDLAGGYTCSDACNYG